MSGIRLDPSKFQDLGRAGDAARTASDAKPFEEGLAEEPPDDGDEDEHDAAA